VIGDDAGGVIDTYVMWIDRLRASEVPVRIEGICHSACTLTLSLPRSQVCVASTATFGFHLATAYGLPLTEYTEALVRRHYPLAVQKWIARRGGLSPTFIYMSAMELADIGVFPMCAKN